MLHVNKTDTETKFLVQEMKQLHWQRSLAARSHKVDSAIPHFQLPV